MSDYTHVWFRSVWNGYERVPCRLLGFTASGKRMKIEALRRDGSTVTRYVALSNLQKTSGATGATEEGQ